MTYYKEQTDTAPVASVSLDELQSLQKTTDVAPKKTDPTLAFTLDVREGKEVRTYYLCAASESEKKQWIDTIVLSRKYWAAVKGGALKAASQPAMSVCTEHLETIQQLETENSSLKVQMDEMAEDIERSRSQHEAELDALRDAHRVELAKARAATPVASGRGAGAFCASCVLVLCSGCVTGPASPMVSGRGRGNLAASNSSNNKMALDDSDIPDFDSDDERPVPKSSGGGGGGNTAGTHSHLRVVLVLCWLLC